MLSALVLAAAGLSAALGHKVGKEAYSVMQASRMYDYCMASYCCGNLGHGVSDWSCYGCKKQPGMINITVETTGLDHDSNGFVGYDSKEKVIVVAFSGTDPLSPIDWIDDLDAFLISYPACENSGCKVHQGFDLTYQAIGPKVVSSVQSLLDYYGSNTPLQITGHSLGGALAALCALDFYVNHNKEPEFVYTYGQPRTGNDKFASYYNSVINTHWRVTYHKDPFVHLPLIGMGYWHMITEVFYEHDSNGSYSICNPSGEDPHCADRYPVAHEVTDHFKYMGEDLVNNFFQCKL